MFFTKHFITSSDAIIIFIITIIIIILSVFIPVLADGFPQEFEWLQVSSTLLSDMADLDNAVVWRFSTYPSVPLPIQRELSRLHQLRSIPLLPSCSTFFFVLVLLQSLGIYLSVLFSFDGLPGLQGLFFLSTMIRFYNYHYYYLLIRVFHISVSWWSFTGVWVTANLPKSPGLFSIFWPFSIMQ